MNKDWVHGASHSPVCQIFLQIVVRAVITSSPLAWASSAGMLSAPAGFPFFSDCDCTAASISVRRMGWSSSVFVCLSDTLSATIKYRESLAGLMLAYAFHSFYKIIFLLL